LAKTKIVATIGPATRTPKMVQGLIAAGMRLCRINLSHGSHEDHARTIALVREMSEVAGVHVPVMMDLQGPKIRTGPLDGGPVKLEKNAKLTLTTQSILGTASKVSVSYIDLPESVSPGERILLDDGAIRLKVLSTDEDEVVCRIETSGILDEHKGVNIPGSELQLPSLTDKDIEDLYFGIEQEVDMIALSFVRKAEDVLELKKRLEENGSDIPIIAKLEKPQAIDNLDEILRSADGIMVARGDLGVEMSLEQVPVLQKTIIAKANRTSKPVITATQMLESMIHSPRPTRAEASDVANAILDGTDAIMLSGETAVGDYPVEAVQMMSRIAEEAERSYLTQAYRRRHSDGASLATLHSGTRAIGHAACQAVEDLGAKAIITFSWSGGTALLISKFRPRAEIIVVTRSARFARRMQLYWGVTPLVAGDLGDVDNLLKEMEKVSIEAGLVAPGDKVVMTAGIPVAGEGRTNFMKIHEVGGE